MGSYAGKSADERKADRRHALLDAALDVLAETGPEALTVRGVCRRSQLNDRYFYEHFANCDELIGALYDNIIEDHYVPDLLARFGGAGDDLAARVAAAANVTVETLESDPRYKRVVAHMTTTPALRARREQVIQFVAQVIQADAAEFLGKKDKETELRAIALAAGIFEVLHMWARGELDITGGTVRDFISTMLLSAAETSAWATPSG